MPLKSFMKKIPARLVKAPAGFVVWSGLVLSGCISSTSPILSDAKAILGERIEVHLFTAPKGGNREHTVVAFQWNGSRYLPRTHAKEFGDFTVHPYEGRDLIVQTRAVRAPRPTEYALARRLSDGVYRILPITEDDADEATRSRFCTKTR